MRKIILKLIWGLGFFCLTLFVSIFFLFSAKESDSRLRNTGIEIQWNKKTFSGIVYDLYKNNYPKVFYIVWKGKKLFTHYEWYSNGQIAALYPHQDGKAQGEWKQWYRDGKVRAFQYYNKGVIEGESWVWHANGVVSDYRVYKNGEELIYKSFISDGKPFYNYVIQNGKRVGQQGGRFCKTKKL